VFTKEEGDSLHVAVRSRFFNPDPCKQVAAHIYDAVRKPCAWNWLIFRSEVVEEIDEGSCIVHYEAQGIESGT
jgi:hypothetical protein